MKKNLRNLQDKASRLANMYRSVAVLAFTGVICFAGVQPSLAQTSDARRFNSETPTVFQAAGPNAASIQGTVDQFRAALGTGDNKNNAGPLTTGHREINWDGGGSTATSVGATPFTVFLNTRGANITTNGTGFVQAPASGLATTFNNPTYANIFQAFSPVRLFSPIGSNVTEVEFSVPGSNGGQAATTNGFGVVFTDVDRPDGRGLLEQLFASTHVQFFDAKGRLLFSSFVPASPGDASLSFFGVTFKDARIAKVRITTGNSKPGPNDGRGIDIVMMDDWLYGEPLAQN